MNDKLFVPNNIKVGFVSRPDTYTKKLGYVIYYDQKGVLRKEKSWQSWRNHKIPPLDFINKPTEGFVLNKGVGGQRQSYGWNARNEAVRVYDPRDFEFEISLANLLFILRECNCNKGKGLEGKFVYAWNGTELALLPECCEEYKSSTSFTKLQGTEVKVKDLVEGTSYITKQEQTLIYLGRFNYHFIVNVASYTPKKDAKGVLKKFVFWNGKGFEYWDDIKKIAKQESDIVVPNFAELREKYYKSQYGSKIVELFTKDFKPQNPLKTRWVTENKQVYIPDTGMNPGFLEFFLQDLTVAELNRGYSFGNKDPEAILVRCLDTTYLTYMKDGIVYSKYTNGRATKNNEYRKNSSYYGNTPTKTDWFEPTYKRLYAKLESGEIFRIENGHFKEKSKAKDDVLEEEFV